MALAAVMVALLVATPPELIRRSAHPGQEPTFAMLLLVLVVPIAEELYFRGLLLARLRELLGDLGAAVAVSLLFGFLHLAQSSHLEMAALSLGLCFLTIWAGTVAWAVLGHVAWNGAAVLLGSQAGEGRTWPALAAAAALAVGGLWLFWRARAAGPVEPGSSEASAGEKLAPVLGLGPGQGRRRDKTPGAHDRSKRKG
jgi:membrane protease YdiL (CAAX protease family)